MSFGKQPTPPDPTQTSNQQQQYNINAGKQQQELNMVNQNNPLGSQQYKQTGTNPDGTPIYSMDTSYSPGVQSILDSYLRNIGTTGNTAGNLAQSIQGMYSKAPNLDINSTLGTLSNWNQSYNAPIFKQQQSNLDAQLRNQGIAPGSAAYANAENLLARNQGDVTNQFFQQAEPLAFNQAVTNYQLPLQTYAQLTGMVQPTAPNFSATPTAQVQPANYSGTVQNNYNAQMQQYQNQQAGMWGLIGTGLGAGGKLAGQYFFPNSPVSKA